jgi:hypothetical protein
MSTTTIFLLAASFCQAADAPPRDAVRCPPDIKQEEYAGRPMRNPVRQIFRVNQTFKWLREPLLRRLPDGSLCCVFFTGGAGDGHIRNVVAAIRSDDDGKTWSDVEILAGRPNQGCWAPSMFVHKNKAHLFWFTKSTGFRDMTNRLMMWVSSDGMQSWYLKRTIVSAPKIAMYPDAFYEENTQAIYLAWEDGETIFFQIILLEELA